MTRTPFRLALTALGAIAGCSFASIGTASAQGVSIQLGTQDYDRGRYYGGNSQLLYCESDEHRYERCRTNGAVSRVYIQDRRSDAPCRQGRDWGYDRNEIWVRNGCRAVFAINYSDGYADRRYDDRRYGDRRYDDRRYDDRRRGDRRGGYANNGRDTAIRTCRVEIEQDLRRAGFRDIDFEGVRYANPQRGGSGWDVGLEYEYEGRRRDFDRTVSCRYDRGRAYVDNGQYRRYSRR